MSNALIMKKVNRRYLKMATDEDVMGFNLIAAIGISLLADRAREYRERRKKNPQLEVPCNYTFTTLRAENFIKNSAKKCFVKYESQKDEIDTLIRLLVGTVFC